MKSDLREMTAHNNLHAVLFATSAEYIALTAQTYQLARHALIDRLREKTFRNPAIIFDLDETILNNVPYHAWLIKCGFNYEETTWDEWCHEGSAEALAGSVEFVRFAKENGVQPIFITSRQNATRVGTARNLLNLGLISDEEFSVEEKGSKDADHPLKTLLFMKGMDAFDPGKKNNDPVTIGPCGNKRYNLKTKFEHRVFCEKVRGFEVIMSLGDNLGDYAEYYGMVVNADGDKINGRHPTTKSRVNSALQDMQLFGRHFILLPNPAYGGWLRAYEENGIGAPDEMFLRTDKPKQRRVGLREPVGEYVDSEGETRITEPKLGKLCAWKGPRELRE